MLVMAGFTTFTSALIAAVPLLEPAFEMTLQAADVHEDVITGFRVHKTKNAATFCRNRHHSGRAQDHIPRSFRHRHCQERPAHKLKWANIHNAWMAAKVNLEVNTKVDAVSRARLQPIQFLAADWPSSIVQFKSQYGMAIHDAKLPAQSCCESFEERLHSGVVETETLAHEVSLEEEREQISSRPEPPAPVGVAPRRDTDAADQKEIHVFDAHRPGISTNEVSSYDKSLVVSYCSFVSQVAH